jgi:hypothetical protein
MTTTNVAPGAISEEANSAILQRLESASEMLARGAGADLIIASAYWPEIVAIAEGNPTIFRGMDEFLPFAREFVPQLGRNVEFAVNDPIVASGDLASSVVQATCRHHDRPDEVFRLIYVWQRRGNEWKIVQEMMCSDVPS